MSLITYTASARTPTLSLSAKENPSPILRFPRLPPFSHLSRHGVTMPRAKETNVYYDKKGSNCATATFLSRALHLLLRCQLKGIISANRVGRKDGQPRRRFASNLPGIWFFRPTESRDSPFDNARSRARIIREPSIDFSLALFQRERFGIRGPTYSIGRHNWNRHKCMFITLALVKLCSLI